MQAANLHLLTQERSLLTQFLAQQVEDENYETIHALITSIFEADAFHEVLDLVIKECQRRGEDAQQWKAIATILDGAADLACDL